MPSLTEFLSGLTIGTHEVPVISCGGIKPFSQYPDDRRRTLTVKLFIPDGADLVDDAPDLDLPDRGSN